MNVSTSSNLVEWRATRVFYDNLRSEALTVVNVGGARSSKSYSIAQLMISKFFSERRKNFLSTRKTFPALRQTAYKVAIDILKENGLYRYVEHNKTEHTLRNPRNGNYWIFQSVDDPEKIKSTEFNYVHMEEGNEFSYEDYRILKLRLSGSHSSTERNQLFITLNPSDDQGWIRTHLLQEANVELIRSTYHDNPFIPESYIKELEALKDQDDAYYQIYALGEWAIVRELIYGPNEITSAMPTSVDETIFGLDFGFNNPSVLLEIRIKEYFAFINELIHESHLTNADLIARMKEKIHPSLRMKPIYADSSEPARIEEISRAGFNVHASEKDVVPGILFCKRFKRFSLADNVETNAEFRGYKWKTDRLGHVLDEPVKYRDHAPDAFRYALFSHLGAIQGKGFFLGISKSDFQ